MNRLIISISENYLRALLSSDGTVAYCQTFDISPYHLAAKPLSESSEHDGEEAAVAAFNSPYLIFYEENPQDSNPWVQVLKKIVKQIKSEVEQKIDSTHLIMPVYEIQIDNHKLPKMAAGDVEKIISRKITTDTKEEFPPVKILPAESDAKIQSWFSLYLPTSTINDYKKLFASSTLPLSTVTSPIHAFIDAFRTVRDAIFNSHAIFEIQRGSVDAYYISSDGLLHFQTMSYATSENLADGATEEEQGKALKNKVFKVLNTIFSINSYYNMDHPNIPVQMAWVCGLESGLDEVASALEEAMGVEVGIAPAIPTGNDNESGYVPLIGYAASLEGAIATNYTTASFLKRFPLRKTYGMAIYGITGLMALMIVLNTENRLNKLKKELPPEIKQQGGKKVASSIPNSDSNLKNIDALKKVTSHQFVFYNLFRELANDLPEAVYIESFEYKFKDDKGVLALSAISSLENKHRDSLQLFMQMLDRSPYLKNHQEPTVAPVKKGEEKFLKISITAEVKTFEPKN